MQTQSENEKLRENRYLIDLINAHPELSPVTDSIASAYLAMKRCFATGGKVLVAGNGGSAADAEHIVGELMKGFKKRREISLDFAQALTCVDADLGAELSKRLQMALPAIALHGHPSLTTAFMNDCDPLMAFAQQVNGYGKENDVLLAISTSGESKNILYAAVTAKAKKLKVVGLTGKSESRLSRIADVCVKAPAKETYLVQELHLPIYHCWCLMLEEALFPEE
ncbi:MAG: SIS domain-containing protein [Synergistes sp.]|nr:SIS domain-containing protein [Synergistes sp.]